MKRSVFAVAATVWAAFVAPGHGQVVRSVFDFYLGGIKGAELVLDGVVGEDAYSGISRLRTAGVVGFFYDASFEARAEGSAETGQLRPSRFVVHTRSRGESQKVEMDYTAEAPARVEAQPAFKARPWQLDPAQQAGTLDPLTAALHALAPRERDALCNTALEIFDARRRYTIELGPPEADGDRVRCAASYRRIAGFKPKMMQKQALFPFTVWFAPGPDGWMHLDRAEGETSFGIAVIARRS